MPTYSINIGTPTETTKLDSLNDVLNVLIDNTSKLISPKDIRDSIFTAWENSPLKLTKVTSSSVEYLGIDNDSIKNKMFFGKKKFSGQETLNNTLLTSDTDIFFFNGKDDSNPTLQDTKITLLAGLSQSLYLDAPYILSKVVNGPDRLVLDITNDSGEINITSNDTISLNGLNFPSVVDNASATDGYVLKKQGSDMVWQATATASVEKVESAATASLIGNPVYINSNGIPIDLFYSNSTPTLVQLGQIMPGTTFSNVTFKDMFDMILYPYVAPTLSLSFLSINGYAGSLTSPVVIERSSLGASFQGVVQYNIGKKTNIIGTASYTNSSGVTIIPVSITPPAISSSVYGTTSVTFGSSLVKNVVLFVQDSGSQSSTISATVSVEEIYPFFYGFSPTLLNGTSIPTNLFKDVSKKSNKTFLVNGTGYLYFAYPQSYGNLTYVNDGGMLNQLGAFTLTTSSLTSPIWSPPTYTYNVYRTGYVSISSTNYTFIF